MSIASELSCEVATAMLARDEKTPEGGGLDLAGIVLEVHSTLRQLTREARLRRRSQFLPAPDRPAPTPPDVDDLPGGH